MRHPGHREKRALYSCMAWRPITSPLSKLKSRLDSVEAAQGAPTDPCATQEESGVLGFPSR